MPNTEPDSTQIIALVAPFNHEGKLLLLKRKKNQHCGGLWSFPGGKVENHENSRQAAMRELLEETGLSGSQWRELGETDYQYSDRSLKLVLFSCLCPDISELHTETEHIWVPSDKLIDYAMPKANAALLPMLKTSIGETP